MISIISKIDGTSREERYPVSIIVLASKVSDRRTKSEKRIRKLSKYSICLPFQESLQQFTRVGE